MIDRRRYMDEGTKAIIKEISREIVNEHEEKFNKITEKNNEYLDGKFLCLENKIEIVKKIVDALKTGDCQALATHITSHKDKEKRIIKTVTLISVLTPTFFIAGGWIKGIIIGWIQKPHN